MLATIAALALSGDILSGHKGGEFYHRALSKKANSKKKAQRKQRQHSQRRNRRKR
ncbi:hypothetical protein LCGC14_1604110 [marine sediment metagenome]|uniref:Uncharacterized protein n=1 Tax=marine sediment metagenome TaxID=412755 RepID=A0A0F9IAN5_9ZZZZ